MEKKETDFGDVFRREIAQEKYHPFHRKSKIIHVIEKKVSSGLWRPNNYRRQIKIKRLKLQSQISVFRALSISYKTKLVGNYRFIYVKPYKGFTLRVSKNCVLIIYSQGKKKPVYFIKRDSPEELAMYIHSVVQNIVEKMDKVLYEFLDLHNIKPISEPYWERFEDWFKGEEYIDSIPKKLVFHVSGLKKVYGSGVEFLKTGENKNAGDAICNYILNRAKEDYLFRTIKEFNKAVLMTDKTLRKTARQFKQTSELLNELNNIFRYLDDEKLTQEYIG